MPATHHTVDAAGPAFNAADHGVRRQKRAQAWWDKVGLRIGLSRMGAGSHWQQNAPK